MCGLKDVVFIVWWSQSVSPLGRLQSTVEKHSRIPANPGIGKSMATFCLTVFLRWEKSSAMPSKFYRGGSSPRSKPLPFCIPFCIPLRTSALIVSAHPYCACQFTRHVMHRARALWTMVGHMAIAIALPGFNDFGRSMTPISLFGG